MQGPHGLVNIAQDSFYRDLTPSEAANVKAYNFDHPDAFAFEEIIDTLRRLRAGLSVDIPVVSLSFSHSILRPPSFSLIAGLALWRTVI